MHLLTWFTLVSAIPTYLGLQSSPNAFSLLLGSALAIGEFKWVYKKLWSAPNTFEFLRARLLVVKLSRIWSLHHFEPVDFSRGHEFGAYWASEKISCMARVKFVDDTGYFAQPPLRSG